MGVLLGRELRLLAHDGGMLAQLWLMPLLILFVAGLFVPATALTQPVVTLIVLLTILMVTLPLTARLWQDDMTSGVAEQIMLAQHLLPAAAARLLALLIAVYLPVCLLVAGGAALWLGYVFTVAQIGAVLLLAVAMAALSLLIAALTATLRYGALLVALLLVPFVLPVFVAFAALPQLPVALNLLAAAAVLAAPLCVLATASVLRQQLSV